MYCTSHSTDQPAGAAKSTDENEHYNNTTTGVDLFAVRFGNTTTAQRMREDVNTRT